MKVGILHMEPTDNTDATLFLPLEMCHGTEEQNISPPFLSLPPSLSVSASTLPILNLVQPGSRRGPDGGNLIARQGQDSALSMVLRRPGLDVIIKLDRTSFKSMPPPDVLETASGRS